MPVYQVHACHTSSCRDLCTYLTHDDRAVGYAYNHCLETDRHGRSVYQQLDEARKALVATWPMVSGNSRPPIT